MNKRILAATKIDVDLVNQIEPTVSPAAFAVGTDIRLNPSAHSLAVPYSGAR